jgi:hypothetical protein
VARITGLSPARVARLERRGLRHLLAARGTCAGAGGGAASAAFAAALASGTTTGGPGAATAASADRGKVLAEHLSGGDGLASSGAGEGSTSAPSIARPTGPGGNSFVDLGYPLVAVALAIFAFALAREVRRPT